MKKLITINVAKDFSTEPAGRFPSDGDFCGENFREKLLIPALKTGAKIKVELDGTEGYGSSFLEEAFGGVIRKHNLTSGRLHEQIELVSEEDESLLEEVWDYIDTARPEK